MPFTAAELVTATELAAGTADAADMPLFNDGDQVCCLEDYSTDFLTGAAGADTRKKVYVVRTGGVGYFNTTGANVNDQTLVPADASVTNRAYPGFAHTTTPAATTAATTNSRPWGYTLVPDTTEANNFATGTKINIHQSRITTKAQMEVFIAAQFSTIW